MNKISLILLFFAAILIGSAVKTTAASGAGGNEIKIEAVANSPAFPGARARFASLKDGDVLKDPNVSVVVDVENFELGVADRYRKGEGDNEFRSGTACPYNTG